MFGLRNQTKFEMAVPVGALGPYRTTDAQLSDADIRAALSKSGGWGPFMNSELSLEEVECWRGYVRADYIIISEGTLSVVEIKSDLDTLRRFDDQARVYNAMADRVTLIVGWTLAARALRAAPVWWDVVLAERSGTDETRFVPLRDGSPNPRIAPAALVAMLPVGELRRLASTAGLSTGMRAASELRKAVAREVSTDCLRRAACDWLVRLSQQRGSVDHGVCV